MLGKNIFEKGNKKFSDSLWTITGIEGYNIRIELNGRTMHKKYWELLKV